MRDDAAQLLRLLHIADSALPVGATAHSFGLETLVQDGDVDLPLLERWFADYLQEAGTVDAYYCRRAHAIGLHIDEGAPTAWLGDWRAANQELSALRPARESRAASHALGGRLLRLLADLEPRPAWQAVLGLRMPRRTTAVCLAWAARCSVSTPTPRQLPCCGRTWPASFRPASA